MHKDGQLNSNRQSVCLRSLAFICGFRFTMHENSQALASSETTKGATDLKRLVPRKPANVGVIGSFGWAPFLSLSHHTASDRHLTIILISWKKVWMFNKSFF